MSEDSVRVEVDRRGVATVSLNRPDKSNAMSPAMITLLGEQLASLEVDGRVRVIALRAAGRHFCAGADVSGTAESNAAGRAALTITELCARLDRLAKPVIGVVQGACVGGGVALAACCDIVIAAGDAFFAVSEVRLGFAPAPLMPFFVRALGTRAARRYVLTGERMSATEALRIGFVHRVEAREGLDAALAAVADDLLLGAPSGIADAKALIAEADGAPITDVILQALEARFEQAHASAEAKEGIASFREKRRPSWYPAP